MPHVSLMFPSKYLSADDLQGREATVVIQSVSKRKLRTNDGKSEDKWLMKFQGKKKELVLTGTNAKRIAKLWGPNSEGWIEKPVVLHTEFVNAFGRDMDVVRVKNVKPSMPGQNTNPAPPPNEPPPDDVPPPSDDGDDFVGSLGGNWDEPADATHRT